MAGNRVISAVLTLKDKDFGTTAQKSASAMKDLERKTKHSSNTVKDFGKSATSNFKKIALGATAMVSAIGITKGISKGFNMVRDSVGSAFERIDTMESFDRVLTTITGSAEDAKAALDTTTEAVTGTAYGLNVAAKGVQDFATRGMDVSKAADTIAIWGDAVAFYGEGSNEQLATVSDALAKMYSKGKVDMSQMNRLFDAGIDAVGMYAKATDRDIEGVQKDLSSGKISAEEFIDTVSLAMTEGTNGVEKIAGAAKDAGASWGASFDNMKAAVTRGTMKIIQSIDEMLEKNGLPDMRTMIATFGRKFEGVLGMVAEKVPIVTEYLVGMYEKAKPGIDWMKDTAFPAVQDGIGFATDKAKEMYDFFVANWPVIGPIVAGVAATIAAFKIGIVAITAAKTTWAAVTSGVQIATALLNGTLAISPLGWVAFAIGAVVAAGVALWKNWDTVKEKAGELWEKTREVFGGIYDWGMEKIQPVTGFFQSMSDKFNAFKDTITSFKPPEWVMKIGGAIGTATGKVKNVIAGSHATGLNRVPYNGYVAELHKDEMVVPATQARNLRRQGTTIDNIDQDRPQEVKQVTTSTSTNQTSNNNVFHIVINAKDKSVSDIVNELVPLLKLRLANM